MWLHGAGLAVIDWLKIRDGEQPLADVFVSYARADKARVAPLVELIERQGWSVFWDTQLVPGDQWRQHLLKEIQSCTACVVVWSTNSASSEWVVEEAALAKSRKVLVPVLIDAVEVPFGFQNLQTANLVDWRQAGQSNDQASLVLSRLRVLIERIEPAPHIATSLSRIGYPIDMRAVQAASDQVSSSELLERYDFSAQSNADPAKALTIDADGAVWVDFAADMGGRFEPGFTLTYLMGFESLHLPDVGRLAHGAILVTSDGLAPADIDRFDYEVSIRQKFGVTQNTGTRKRRLFAISGPYENLLGQRLTGHLRRVIREFLLIRTSERAVAWFDALFCSARQGKGEELGAWECDQHRSYWAVRLPFDWLIWGVDVLLDNPVDVPQFNYFERIADRTSPVDRIIICLAQAPWLASRETKGADPIAQLIAVAQKNGAKVSVLLAGGAHYYSRYVCKDRGLHCITAGGATGPLQPTHYLKYREGLNLDGTRQRLDLRVKVKDGKQTTKPACWPSRATSRRVSLGALAFPFRNYGFTITLGAIYWLMIWIFATTSLPGTHWHYTTVGEILIKDEDFRIFPDLFLVTPLAIANNVLFEILALAFWVVLYIYADPQQGRNLRAMATSLHWAGHIAMMLTLYFLVSWSSIMFMNWVWPLAKPTLQLFELDASHQVQELVRTIVVFPLVSIFLGGLVGPGFVWGLYLLVSTLFLRMHRAEAFDALGIYDYKTFLRMRFSKEGAVVYPIGVKTVLRSRDLRHSPAASTEGSAFVPARPLEPQLIEGPIVIGNDMC
jgi:TIR domain